jgi:dTDP-4-dehydrorhamnose reductase
MARLLITGGSGFIGGRLLERAGPGWERSSTYLRAEPFLAGVDWHRLDLRDAMAVEACLGAVRPELVIHTAYDKSDAEAVIARGTSHLCAAARRVAARVLMTSTDLVFDGRRGSYREDDPPCPLDGYGAAKVAAERVVLSGGGLVARTSLVYRIHPPDPANHALLVAPIARGEIPCLFTDEYRTPIHVDDLADALLELATWPPEAWAALPGGGILHVAGPERLDRYTFGRRLAPVLGVDLARLRAGTLAASGLLRAADSSLDSSRARELLGTRLRPLDEVLASA